MPESDVGAESASVNELFLAVYGELRELASTILDRERPDHTLQPTALVHEVFLRLSSQRTIGWHSREEFMAVAGKAMRRVLVDYARAKKAKKRGVGKRPEVIELALDQTSDRVIDLVGLDEQLSLLAEFDERAARVVEMRFFAGMTFEQISGVLGISTRTAERSWRSARAWLFSRLSDLA